MPTKHVACIANRPVLSEVSLAQGLVVDHAPPTIAASYDKALLWMMKKTVLMSTDSSYKQEFETYLGFTIATGH